MPTKGPDLAHISPARTSPHPWAMGAIFLWALLLRLIYLRQISSNPFFSRPIMDPGYHDEWAQAIASGDWIGHEAFFRAPFYPYFLGLVYWLFGHDYLVPRIIQAVLGSISCVLLYLITRRLFGERAGLLAGALCGAYGMLIYFDAELLLPVMEILFDLLMIWLLLRAADGERWLPWWLAGVATGVSAIVRPNILLVAVGVAVWIWVIWRRAGFRRRVLAYGVGVMMLVLPITVRNAVVGGDFVLISSQGGINFYLGNNPNADGWSATAPEFPRDWWGGYLRSIEIADENAGHPLKPSGVSRYWFGRAVEFLREDTGGFFLLWARKLHIFWQAYEFGNNQIVYFFKRYAPLLRLPLPGFGWVAPPALAAMILFTRDRRRALLVLFVLIYMTSIVAFFVNDKLRLPVVPSLVALGSAFVVWCIGSLKRGRTGAVVGSLLLVASLAVVVNHDFWGIPHPTFASSHAAVGAVYLEEGRLEDARREFRACAAIDPTYQDVHLNLGAVLSRMGRLEDAEAEYRLELRYGGEDPLVLANLGSLVQRRGEYEEAADLYQRALALGATDPRVRYNLGLCLSRLEKPGEAAAEFRGVLAEEPENLAALNMLGVVEAERGRYDEAVAIWKRALEIDSTFVLARDNLEAAQRERKRMRR